MKSFCVVVHLLHPWRSLHFGVLALHSIAFARSFKDLMLLQTIVDIRCIEE